jgi:hypothetical protein
MPQIKLQKRWLSLFEKTVFELAKEEFYKIIFTKW